MSKESLCIGIVVALPEEVATLTKHKLTQGNCFQASEQLFIVYAGAGTDNAEKAVKTLSNQGVNALISWGCAAALADYLQPGDLVLPEQVIFEQQVLKSDPAWQKHIQAILQDKLPLVSGVLLHSNSIVASSTDKKSLHQQTGAVALDMESFAVFNAANQQGLPCVAIRAIADPVTMDLPQAVVKSLNQQGQVEITKLLSYLLFHPLETPGLIKLGIHFQAAGKTLKLVATKLNEIALLNNLANQVH